MTYRSGAVIEACLQSLAAKCPGARVVVVDNSSDAETRATVESVCAISGQTVDYLDAETNLGYAKAVNVGEAFAEDSDMLLILNPDTRITRDPLEFAYLLEEGDICAGTLIPATPEPPVRIANARPRVTLGREVLRSAFGSRVYRGPKRSAGSQQRVDQLDGAYLLMRRSWYRQHRFDEYFDLYYEDVSICDAARRERGCIASAEIAGVHLGGASAELSGGLAYRASRVSRARYLRRRYPGMPTPLLAVLFRLEALSRRVARKPEPPSLRRHTVDLAIRELKTPGAVRVLESSERHKSPGPEICP